MTKFQRAPQSEVQSSEWRTPAEVLFRRNGRVSGGSPACRPVLPISSGFRVDQSKRGVSSVGCVGCVGCVRCVRCVSVSGSVAYLLRPVASANGQSPEGAKSMFLRMLQQSRRATVAIQSKLMQQRLADQATGEVQRQSSVGSVAFELRQLQSRPSASCLVASRSDQLRSSELSSHQCRFSERRLREHLAGSRPVQSVSCVRGVPIVSMSKASRVHSDIAESVSEMSKVASVAFRASVQSAVKSVASPELVQSRQILSRKRAVASVSVAPVECVQSSAGEWRQVGDALSSVLGRVRAVVEASALTESVEHKSTGQMH